MIPTLEWNEEEHLLALDSGIFLSKLSTDHFERPSMQVEMGVGDHLGFHAAALRCVVVAGLSFGTGGRLHCRMSPSHFITAVFLGMLPIDKPVSFVTTCFGPTGYGASLKYVSLTKMIREGNTLTTRERGLITHLKEILVIWRRFKTKLEGNDDDEIDIVNELLKEIKETPVDLQTISDQELINSGDTFKAIAEKRFSFVKSHFVPNFLDLFEKKEDPMSITSVRMSLSDLGIERWTMAITERKGFPLFGAFEPLQPMMSPGQINRLYRIITTFQNLDR